MQTDKDNCDKILAFDSIYTNNHIQMYKLLLPYFEPEMQKKMAIYIKFMEFQYTLSYFKNHPYACQPRQPMPDAVQGAFSLLQPGRKAEAGPFCPVFFFGKKRTGNDGDGSHDEGYVPGGSSFSRRRRRFHGHQPDFIHAGKTMTDRTHSRLQDLQINENEVYHGRKTGMDVRPSGKGHFP